MKRIRSLSLFPRFGGHRTSFKIGVVATLAIAVAANVAVLGNLNVLFGHVVPGASHQNLLVPYFQPLQYKSLPPSQWGIYRPVLRSAGGLARRARRCGLISVTERNAQCKQ